MSTSSITTVITDAGFSLLRAAPGHKLIYTRAVCGSGYVEKTQLATQTEVTDYVMDLSIVEFGPTESAATLRLQLDNSKAPKEFQLYQIGIFAKLLDEEQELIGETLIQIMQYEEPDIVRAVPHVSEFVVNVLLGQAEKVEGIIDMAAYVSLRHFSSRTVNGKPLSADVTLTGEDINVSDSDPTTVKAALSNKADLVDGQVPYSQMPHMTKGKTIYVATTGDDSNQGTQESPFRTIQAAINSLPKDLSTEIVAISIADGTYDEDISILSFHGGNLDYGLLIQGNPYNPSAVKVRRIEVRSCSAVIQLSGMTIVGTRAPILFLGRSNVSVGNVTVQPDGDKEYFYSNYAVVVGRFSNVYASSFNVSANNTWGGVSIYIGVLYVNKLSIKNCGTGLSVGDSSNESPGIAIFYNQPTFDGNTLDVSKDGAGSIISGLEGQ